MVGASSVPRNRGSSLGASAKGLTLTPLGMTTASPPWYWMRVRRASSETAMRAESFSISGTVAGLSSSRASERSMAAWKVPTTGPVAACRASIPTLGVMGSWMCRMSKSPASSQRRARLATRAPKLSRATEPL